MSNKIPGGYNGKVVRVNLSNRKIEIENISDAFCRKYLGGAGFIAYYLYNEVKEVVDPLGPDNKLIFASGPLTGLNFPGAARHAVGAKSPLTGGIVKSEVGEYWGAQFTRAGFDALIVEGMASNPVYLDIQNGKVKLKDASSLWGLTTSETQQAIRKELGDDKIRVAMIGPGGENLVKYACIMHGTFDAAGRGGLGAVMGSKNLKAVSVRGNQLPPIHDKKVVKKTAEWLKDNFELVKVLNEYGTGAGMGAYEKFGNLPIRNFRDGTFPTAEKISAITLKDSFGIGMNGCFACPVRCKKKVSLKEPYDVDSVYGGPEYETLAAFGSACGIDDLRVIAKCNEICNANGIDTMSAGLTIAFAMECFENNILNKSITDGIELTFGNSDALIEILEQIIIRKGIGNVLADGSARAAKKFGQGSDSYAMHVKGMELPLHEPRLSKSLGLTHMIQPHGADHMDSLLDIFYSALGQQPNVSVPDALPLGFGPVPVDDIGPQKVALAKLFQQKRILTDTLVLCVLLPYSFDQIADITSGVTGWNTSVLEQLRVAERILTMCRQFNLRQGLSVEDDKLPQRFYERTHDGPLAKRNLNYNEMNAARRYYYLSMGWDENGVPLPEKLEELGI
jgi:aldehyde:ferredoxin oxidoreductase